jgi:hypothetical protein
MSKNWQEEIKEYCAKYNIPITYLAETLYEPKVVPMIRGKAFEFSALIVLQDILPQNEWKITKAVRTDESGFHDTDIRVFHKRTGRTLRIECKLAKQHGYRLFPDGHSEIRVKCMRSRTLGIAKVKELAPKLGIPEGALAIHNDQYVAADFDLVITSIGNAFYRTDKKTGLYEWKPKKIEEEFLKKIEPSNTKTLKDVAFESMYVVSSKDIAVKKGTGVICSRKKCPNKSNCGFIPNYPVIRFDSHTIKPNNKWVPLKESQALFKNLVTQ